jgi:hypothetical protein
LADGDAGGVFRSDDGWRSRRGDGGARAVGDLDGPLGTVTGTVTTLLDNLTLIFFLLDSTFFFVEKMEILRRFFVCYNLKQK